MCSHVHIGSRGSLLFKTNSDSSSGLIKLSCVHVPDAYVHRILWLCPNLLCSSPDLIICACTCWIRLRLLFLSICARLLPYNCFTVLIILLELLSVSCGDCCAWSQWHVCAQSTIKSTAMQRIASDHGTLHAASQPWPEIHAHVNAGHTLCYDIPVQWYSHGNRH